jgi:nitrite reductase (NADH) large subunit
MDNKYKYLIIGGGAAGTTAAETLRQNDQEGGIAIISDEPRFYSRIMLSKPNFFLGKIPFDNVWLKQKEWYEENKITFIENVLATKLDANSKTVTLSNGQTLQYEKLLLATGGEAKTWPIQGSDKKGICYVRDLSQVNELIENIKTSKQTIVVGSGFVGFEVCEMAKLAGLEVTVVMREPYFWYPLLDAESAKMIEEAMQKEGIKILKETEVSKILGDERIEGVILKDGTQLECQLAIIGIGLVYHIDWLKEAGVKINRGILANEYLETNVPDIYTAGDVTEFNDLILGKRVQFSNWANAQMQGRTAANNMLGKRDPFKMVSFCSTIGFGLNIAMSGDVRVEPEYKIIKRGSPEINSFARIIVDTNDEIVGGTFINRLKDMAPINKLIETDFKVSGHESSLSDPDFDLKQLI